MGGRGGDDMGGRGGDDMGGRGGDDMGEKEGRTWEEEEGMTWEEEEGRTAQTALAVQHTPNTCLLHSPPPSIVEVGQLVPPCPTHLPRPPCDATVQLSA